MVTCLGKTRSASKNTQGSSMPWPKERSFAPQMSCTRERTISISPKEAITRMMVEPWRSGRKKSRSMPSTASAVNAIARGRTAKGCQPVKEASERAKKAPSVIVSPCAKFAKRRIPKVRVTPIAPSA